MKFKFLNRLTIIGFMLGALCYWLQPINDPSLYGINIWFILAGGSLLIALLLGWATNVDRSTIALSLSAGIVLAVIARIVYDLLFVDNTSHNLAFVEIVMAVVFSLPNTFIGVYSGRYFKQSKKNTNADM